MSLVFAICGTANPLQVFPGVAVFGGTPLRRFAKVIVDRYNQLVISLSHSNVTISPIVLGRTVTGAFRATSQNTAAQTTSTAATPRKMFCHPSDAARRDRETPLRTGRYSPARRRPAHYPVFPH